MKYENIIVKQEESVGIITLNKPKSYNALSTALIKEVSSVIENFDEDENIGAIILTGGDKVFAAGVDIKELSKLDFVTAYKNDFITKEWKAIENHKKPIIAAVSGVALGGGCELTLLCDIAICDTTARFGQPEVKLGTMPGIGGTQRLVRIIGKSKAMQMCLTGDMINAEEAKNLGLVAEVFKEDELLNEAIIMAKKIASMSQPVIRLIKESIDSAYETTLQTGLKNERKYFYTTFDLEDKKEGMKAFLEKRKAIFTNK